ncbi:hypothetical protein A9264_13340 [Vibrio sp. UCD-FRSSP16_10]|uniref:DUF3859 domain-containing protein n=1 Tax=unclassified Vibrio TaxID=2614977 RepID=UPI0007FCB2F2|nr:MULTISPECIES: DUF3859 domain-containing protein [unclassified Vibrio]OBT14813.1 hypothetical protein A9260_13555 [Vibrio sp. UCD-FRSSP16_30]OBT20101.1 hypothetical protein A9264_13340 [Vibrio sp. UCD-FRSSP16_10]
MAKRTPIIKITSYGIYSHWDADSKDLPKITQFTNTVVAEEGVEFGFIVNIKKAKGTLLNYCIHHPGIINKKGKVLAPFDGEIYVRSNDWDFYLGDTIQLLHPVDGLESNLGEWSMTLEANDKVIAQKSFKVVARDEGQFWKQRGY